MAVSAFQIVIILLSLACSCCLAAAGVLLFISGGVTVQSVILGIYFLLFGVFAFVCELWWPPQLASLFPPFGQFWGKAFYFLFFGLLIIQDPNDGKNVFFWLGLVNIVGALVFLILGLLGLRGTVSQPKAPYGSAA
jgi:hypothetical protein